MRAGSRSNAEPESFSETITSRGLEDARSVLGRFDQHAAALETLRASARPYDITARRRDHPELFKQIDRRRAARLALQRRVSDDEPLTGDIARVDGEIESLLARTEERHSWSFERPEDRRLHDVLMSVLDEYRSFSGGAEACYARKVFGSGAQ